MSDEKVKTSPSSDDLSSALRELARSGPRSAPPKLGLELGRAFHRHHLHRRLARMAAALLLVVSLGGGALWMRTGSPAKRPETPAQRAAERVAPGSPLATTTNSVQPESRQSLGHSRRASASPRSQGKRAKRELFVALPAFAFGTSQEQLRVIRVDMPVSSLRLLGAQVSDEMSTRRVTTDLLVGPDGTPYAFRLVT